MTDAAFSDPATAQRLEEVRRLSEAMLAAIREAQHMAGNAQLASAFAELLMHIDELRDLMTAYVAELDPGDGASLRELSEQARAATHALIRSAAH